MAIKYNAISIGIFVRILMVNCNRYLVNINTFVTTRPNKIIQSYSNFVLNLTNNIIHFLKILAVTFCFQCFFFFF